MVIKKMLCKHDLGYKEWYVDDSLEFHSLQEVRDYCYENADYWHMRFKDNILYKFKIVDSDDEIEVVCSVVFDDDGFDYISVVGKF
jgi:hypothetical protein